MRRTCFVALFLAIAGLTGVHLYVMAQGPHYSGFLLVLDHLFELVLVSSLLALCAAVGKQLLTRCRCAFESSLETVLFSVGVGCGVVATAILLLGFFSGLQAITLTALFVCFAIVSRDEIRALPKLVAQASVEIKRHANVPSLLVFGLVAAFLISQALLPPMDWDTLVYHLRIPAKFLDTGRIHLPEDNLHVAFVQLAHMLYIPLLAYGSIAGPALLSALFALLLGLGVFALANRFFEGPTAGFSLMLLWANTMIVLVAITPRVDVTLGFYLLLAHFALLTASSHWMFFYVSAAVLGFASGVKYHAIAYGLGLTPLIVWVAYLKQGNLRRCSLSSLGYGLIAVAGAFPWLVKNWWLFGAPLYPFFAQRTVDPWLTFLYPEKLQPQIVNVYGEVRADFNLLDLILKPFVLTVEAEALYYHFSALFIGLFFWLIYNSKNRTLNWLMIPPIAYFAVTIVLSSKTNLRYLVPVLAPFTVVAVYVILERMVNLLGQKKALILFYAVSLIALWPTAKATSRWAMRSMSLSYLAGVVSRDDYVTSRSGFGNVVSYVNQHLSSRDRVLMLFEARGFYFEVPVIQDNLFSNWILLARKSSSLNCLKGSGISHVLFNGTALDYFFMRGLDPNIVRLEEFKQFAENCLTPIYQSDKHIVYRVGN